MNEKDRKDTAWFKTQVIDNDSLSFMQKLKVYWKYIMEEVEKLKKKESER